MYKLGNEFLKEWGRDLETSRWQIGSKTLPLTSESEAFASDGSVWAGGGGEGEGCYFKRSGFINMVRKSSLGSMCSHSADCDPIKHSCSESCYREQHTPPPLPPSTPKERPGGRFLPSRDH